jgi:hypothetical protein
MQCSGLLLSEGDEGIGNRLWLWWKQLDADGGKQLSTSYGKLLSAYMDN